MNAASSAPSSASPTIHGTLTYSDEYGHVCTCTERVARDALGAPIHAEYAPTVKVNRDVPPTESGSWWYSCARCGAGGWSGL